MPKFHAQHLLTSPGPEPLLPPGQPDYHIPEEDPFTNPYYNTVNTFITWRAPSRPYRRKDRSYYTTVFTIIGLICIIAFLANQRLLIGVLLALGFLVYVLNYVPPDDIDYKISTQGIIIGEQFYHWAEFDSFWFSKKDGHNILNIVTRFRFPAVLMLVMGDKSEDEIKAICARYLPFHEIAPKTQLEKWSDSLQKHFPLENPQK